MNNLSLSVAQKADLKIIATILTEATNYKLDRNDMIWGKESWTKTEVLDMMRQSTVFVAKRNEEIVGTVSLKWEDKRIWGEQPPTAGYVHRLAVKDTFHGKNIGKQIIDELAKYVLENGRSILRLDCEANNFSLCKYYEKLGFNKVGTMQIKTNNYTAALYERLI